MTSKFEPNSTYTPEDRDAVDGPELHDGKVDVTLDLNPVTLARFKALGDDWRARMSEILEKAEL